MRAGAVTLARGSHRLHEAVGLQADPCQPVVAAIPACELFGQAEFFEAVDTPDPGGQWRRTEIVGAQAAARLFERGEEGGLADTDRRCRSEGADLQGGNA